MYNTSTKKSSFLPIYIIKLVFIVFILKKEKIKHIMLAHQYIQLMYVFSFFKIASIYQYGHPFTRMSSPDIKTST